MENVIRFDEIPENENERILALGKCFKNRLRTQQIMDQIVGLAASEFHVPVAIIAAVDLHTVHFIASTGLGNLDEIPRGNSFCAITVLNEEITVFTDTMSNPCLLSNPWVAGEFGLRFYAGVPLTTSGGLRIGTLCLVDTKPRSFSEEDKYRLEMLSKSVMDQMEEKS